MIVLLIVASLAEAVLINVASAQPSTDWPMFRFNPEHTGTTQNVTPPLELAWNFTTGDLVYSSPAVSGDFVYVGSRDGNIYALDAADGALRWKYATSDWALSSPTVSGGVVYVGSEDRNLYALNAVTGTLKWNYTTGGYVDSSPAVSGGVAYVGSDDRNLYALNAATGVLKWSYTTGGYIESSPVVSCGVVYVGSDDQNIYALDAYTGAYIWSYTTGDLVYSSPAVSGGFLYVGSYDGKVYAFSPSGPQTRYPWPMFHHDTTHTGYSETAAPQTNHTMWSYTTGNITSSSPAVADGIVFIGSFDKNVYALNASTGAEVWSYTTGGYVDSSSPAVADGRVYVGSDDGRVYCLDASNGALVWSRTIGSYVWSSPAVSGGRVYVGSADHVYCLDASTGAIVWNYTTGNSVISSPAVADGRVYVGSYDGRVYCLDAVTGALVWSYTTGGYVYSSPAIADGMVFVGSADDTLYAFGIIVKTEDYMTVQAAINAARPGATVWVAPGVYSESLLINKTITLLGKIGSEPTFNGGGSGIAITIVPSGSGSTIAGITITDWTQGILVNGASGCSIYDNIMSLINQNGISLQGSSASNNLVYDNIFQQDTVAVSLTSSTSNNVITGNMISLSSVGLNLQSGGNMVYANIMTYNDVAINITNSNNNLFFHNDFISSNFQLTTLNSTGNVWDDGYPSGGNYWSDYLTKYPSATEIDGSGIWNTPYVVATGNVDNYPLAKPFSLHNIGVASLVLSKTVIGQSYTPPQMSVLQISLKILNLGTYDESFTLTVVANSTLVAQQTVSLSKGDWTTLTVTWNTADCAKGNFTILATAGPVASEADTSDNNRSLWVVVTIPGDINGDGTVNILDAITLANAFLATPSSSNWNPNADINGDGVVNILDAIILANHFLQHYP